MQYLKLKNVKNPVSRLIYGTAIPQMLSGEDAGTILDAAYTAGITTFDTARSYMDSEVSLGNWIKARGIRESVNILTKGCNPDQTGILFSRKSLSQELTESLKYLQTEFVDLYCLHRDDPETEAGVFIEVLNEFQDQGKINVFGASNWTYSRMEEANEYAYKHSLNGFYFGSPAFSLAEMIGDPWGGSVHISGPSNQAARNWFIKNEIPVFAYSSFARGFFSGKYKTYMKEDITTVLPSYVKEEYYYPDNIERLRRAEQLAEEKQVTVGQINLAWILAQKLNICPILSPSTPEHLAENLKGMEISLTHEECSWMNLEGQFK